MAIDFGERRIGIALSDAAGRIALPWGTLERRNDRSAMRQIADLARREGVGRFVLGDPRTVAGAAGAASERVRRFGDRLAELTGMPVELVGEALTSVEAAERLRQAGVDPRREPGRIDAVAAQILLEEALARGEGGDRR